MFLNTALKKKKNIVYNKCSKCLEQPDLFKTCLKYFVSERKKMHFKFKFDILRKEVYEIKSIAFN